MAAGVSRLLAELSSKFLSILALVLGTGRSAAPRIGLTCVPAPCPPPQPWVRVGCGHGLPSPGLPGASDTCSGEVGNHAGEGEGVFPVAPTGRRASSGWGRLRPLDGRPAGVSLCDRGA